MFMTDFIDIGQKNILINKINSNNKHKNIQMNKIASLPSIQKQLKSLKRIKQQKKQAQANSQLLSTRYNIVQNQQSRQAFPKRIKSQSLFLKKMPSNQKPSKPVISIKQNNNQIQPISQKRSLMTERSRSTMLTQKANHQDENSNVKKIRKEINEVVSSGLILRKEIKAMQGRIIQLKEQISLLRTQAQIANPKAEQKLTQIQQKIQVYIYDKQIYRNMKDRLKKVLINLDKKLLSTRQQVNICLQRSLHLNQQQQTYQKGINKQLLASKNLNQSCKNWSKQKSLHKRSLSKQNQIKYVSQLNQPSLSLKQYQYQMYKQEEQHLLRNIYSHRMHQNMLATQFDALSNKYQQEQKAQQLMKIHFLSRHQKQFQPNKAYKQSFEIKKQLEQKIKQKQLRLTQKMKQNQGLKAEWAAFQYKQIDQKQKIINQTQLQIKTGKKQLKQAIQDQSKNKISKIKRQIEQIKQKSLKQSSIKVWSTRMQKLVNIKFQKNYSLSNQILDIINFTREQNKKRQIK